MTSAKERLKALVEHRDAIEEEIKDLHNVLQTHGTDMTESLVDAEGYPRADIDIPVIRTARHKIICLNNDLKALMAQIEANLAEAHAEERSKKTAENGAAAGMDVESTETDASGARLNHSAPPPRTSNKPFATIADVAADSPAFTAGLQNGDQLIQFGLLCWDGFKNLQQIGEIVQSWTEKPIKVTVIRDGHAVHLVLTPRKWSGQGLLGLSCCGVEIILMPLLRIIRWLARPILLRKCLLIFPLTSLCALYLIENNLSWHQMMVDEQAHVHRTATQEAEPTRSISPECRCVDNATDRAFDFCYALPQNESAQGQRFSCHLLPYMQSLRLVEQSDAYLDLSKGEFPENPMFVTATSDSHFGESMRLVGLVQKFMPWQKLLFYDLGLSEANIAKVKSYCNIVYQKFRFEAYPDYVSNLHEYRWKPILIAEAVRDYGAIWYMDSSVVLFKSNLSHVYELLKCRQGSFDIERLHSIAGRNLSSETDLKNPQFIESGFHLERWLVSIRKCDKFAYMLQGWTGHGIFSATSPEVYKFIPTLLEPLKQETAKMYEAGFALVARTKEVVLDVLRWYVLCALEQTCMAPPGAGLGCAFAPDRYGVYANCHRYDQSVINLLLANRNRYHSYFWTSGIVDFFKIVRGGTVEDPGYPKQCGK